ncbi:MAG TPA: M48 family metalloprotease, partial [Terriglobales bacterium]|nr:M48 family metalloprotease [Terriglobales bacterium]
GLAPSVPKPARAPGGPASLARERAAVASQGRGAAPTAPPARSLPIAASSAAPESVGAAAPGAPPESAGAAAPGAAQRETTRAATSLSLHDEPVSPADSAADMARIRSDFTPLNRAYATTREALGFIDPLYGILVALLILFTRLSAWMRDVARRCGSRRYVHTLVYFALYLVVSFLLGFPLAFYEGFAVEHQYGLSTESFGGWLGQELIALGVGFFFFGVVPLVRLAYAAFARWPRRWWVALGVASLPVILIGVLIEPVVVDPLFNKFTPLQDKHLEAQILDLARRAGIPARHVYQVDKSKQTVKYNAYVNGFGPSQRVVIWDTTLKGMKPDEILFVVGHESGHYKLGHVWTTIALMVPFAFLVFWLSSALMGVLISAWGPRWGFAELHDLASLPLVVLAITVFSFLAGPALGALSRGMEHQADVFGLEVTHSNDAAARTFIKLGSQNRSNPEPSALVKFFEYDHPPLLERVRFAISYRPWAEGKPDHYYRPLMRSAARR